METTFFLPDEPDLDELRRLDPDRDWPRFVRGEHSWVLQTFLRLQAKGGAVTLADTIPREGLVMFHKKHEKVVARKCRRSPKAILVGVRGDLNACLLADLEIVQSRARSDDGRCLFLPHWPQPGLLPRDPARGSEVRAVGFKGYAGNLADAFRSPAWIRELATRGISWHEDAVVFADRATPAERLAWADYRQLDIVLAVRPLDPAGHPGKPATKLYNAWLAGTPALLGPEVAFREERRDDLDYLEVASPEEALVAIDRLRTDATLFRAMVAHGRERARAVTADATAERWLEALGAELPRRAAAAMRRFDRRLSPAVRMLVRRLTRVAARRPLR